MAHITMADIGWFGLLEMALECVSDWKPDHHAREVDYNRALAQFLRRSLPEGVHVVCEYRHSGETVDVYVQCDGLDEYDQPGEKISEDEVFIEVKRRLTRKPDLDRLVGQLSGLNPRKNKTLVVLIGRCNEDLVARLRHQFRPHLKLGFGAATPTMALVEVPEAECLQEAIARLR